MFTQKPVASPLALVALFLFASLAVPASAAPQQRQQTSPSHQPSQQTQNAPSQPPQTSASQQAPPKQHKVWSNEDVVSLRTPEDIYLAEKEAQEVAAAEAAAREAAADKLTKELGLTIELPATAEETQRGIEVREQQMKEDQATLERLKRELLEASADRKPEKQKEIERVKNDLETACVEIKLLRNQLQKFTKPAAPEASPAVPAPPSS